jgi:thymidylate kinase
MDSVDMCGKTEVAKELSDILNIPTYKNKNEHSRWKDHAISLMYGMDELVQILEQTKYSIIFDRFHPSEWVYSREFNRPTVDSLTLDYDRRISNMNGIIIYPYKTEEFFKEDDQKIVNIVQYKSLQNKYEEFFKITNCEVLKYNANDENLEKQILLCLNKIYEVLK